MAEIMSYTPTAGLEVRTKESFYTAINAWIKKDIEPLVSDFFDIDYAFQYEGCDTFRFTPKDENLSAFTLVIECAASGVFLVVTGNNCRHADYKTDPVFHFYKSDDNIFFGMDSRLYYYGLFGGKRFDGAQKLVVCCDNKWCTQGGAFTISTTSPFNRVAADLTSYYRIQSMPVSGTDIVLDKVYYLDGGMSLPPAGEFKIGNDRYCTMFHNVVIKL